MTSVQCENENEIGRVKKNILLFFVFTTLHIKDSMIYIGIKYHLTLQWWVKKIFLYDGGEVEDHQVWRDEQQPSLVL